MAKTQHQVQPDYEGGVRYHIYVNNSIEETLEAGDVRPMCKQMTQQTIAGELTNYHFI